MDRTISLRMLEDSYRKLEKENWDLHCRYIEVRDKHNAIKEMQ